MALFDLIRDERVTIWHRYRVQVEASSQEEAVQILSGENTPNAESWDTQSAIKDISACESLFETEELTDPDEHFGSIEISHPENTEETLWSNQRK